MIMGDPAVHNARPCRGGNPRALAVGGAPGIGRKAPDPGLQPRSDTPTRCTKHPAILDTGVLRETFACLHIVQTDSSGECSSDKHKPIPWMRDPRAAFQAQTKRPAIGPGLPPLAQIETV